MHVCIIKAVVECYTDKKDSSNVVHIITYRTYLHYMKEVTFHPAGSVLPQTAESDLFASK